VPDLAAITAAITDHPNDPARWSALAAWYAGRGRVDGADAVRVLWPNMRDCLTAATLDATLDELAGSARLLGDIARQIEAGREEPDGWVD